MATPTTIELADHLLLTAPEHEGWSIVESPNSAGLYDNLLAWATGMNMPSWHSDLTIRRHQLGLVLLWLESEIARRKGGEGRLWPVLSDRNIVEWDHLVYSELFTGTGAATRLHRDLLRDCAHHYGLRHTFGDEEAQNWFRLIYLQFGFTHDDASNRLALWLSGQHPPISVQRLLDAQDSGAHAFQEMWRSLRMFRLGNINQALIESRLQSNPWVLPEWCADLIQAAKRSSAQIREAADITAAEVKCFTTPRLVVTNEGSPCFTTSLCNLSEFESGSDEYEFKGDEETLARLIRQPDGTYHSDAPEAVRLPLQPRVALSLIGGDGRIIRHDEAILWDDDQDVSLFSANTGLRIDPRERIRSGVELFIIASADLEINPAPTKTNNMPLGYRLHHLTRGWAGALQASLDGDPIWAAIMGSVPLQVNAQPVVSARVKIQLDLRVNNPVEVPPWDVEVLFVPTEEWEIVSIQRRQQGETRMFWEHLSLGVNTFEALQWNDGAPRAAWYSSMVPIREIDCMRPLIFRVGLVSDEERRTEVVRTSLPCVGVFKWKDIGIPEFHSSQQELLLREARRFAWSFSLPPCEGEPRDPRMCSFIEGGTLHGRLKTRRSNLPDLGGYGASLHIVDDPYQSGNPIMEVARCVIDTGVLGNVTRDDENEGFHVRSVFTDLGPDHQLLVWCSDGDGASKLLAIESDSIERLDDGWMWYSPGHCNIHGIALLFRGCRVGSWFNFRSSSQIVIDRPPGTPKEVAALLRVWKAPLLRQDGANRQHYCDWLRQHWVEALPVWLAGNDFELIGPNGFEWPAPDLSTAWLGVVGELLLSAMPVPCAESAGDLVEALAPGVSGINSLGAAVWRIADTCPILAARVAKIYLEEFVINEERATFFDSMLAVPALDNSEDRADEIGKIHGDRDGFWLRQTVPTLQAIEENGPVAILHAYRLLSKSNDYRLYALGRWLSEIR